MSLPPDEHIVKQALGGDTNAFTIIVEQYQKLVVSIVNRMVQQNEDREDLYQEIFLKVYEKLGTFQFKAKLSTWIANIAFNHCANFLQKKKIVLLDDSKNEVFTTEPDPGHKMMNKELGMYLEKSMENLSVIQRTIIQLFHQHEFSLDEIAVITALPVNTVKSHLFRGRAIVKTQMLKYLNH